jgi:hypothetical protein
MYQLRPDRLDTLALNLFFVLLYAVGLFAGFYLLIGARWGRITVSVVALFTVAASVLGLFAYFNVLPFPLAASCSISSRSVLLSSCCSADPMRRPCKGAVRFGRGSAALYFPGPSKTREV